MSCLRVMYTSFEENDNYKLGGIYEIGCKKIRKTDFLILECRCNVLKTMKEKNCKVVSYEWGIVEYENGYQFLLNKEKIKEIQARVKNGFDIRKNKVTFKAKKEIVYRDKKEDYDESMADWMMRNAEADAWEMSFYE